MNKLEPSFPVACIELYNIAWSLFSQDPYDPNLPCWRKHHKMELLSHWRSGNLYNKNKTKQKQIKQPGITGILLHFTDDDTQPREKTQLPLAFFIPTYWTPTETGHQAKFWDCMGDRQSTTLKKLAVQWPQRPLSLGPQMKPGRQTHRNPLEALLQVQGIHQWMPKLVRTNIVSKSL